MLGLAARPWRVVDPLRPWQLSLAPCLGSVTHVLLLLGRAQAAPGAQLGEEPGPSAELLSHLPSLLGSASSQLGQRLCGKCAQRPRARGVAGRGRGVVVWLFPAPLTPSGFLLFTYLFCVSLAWLFSEGHSCSPGWPWILLSPPSVLGLTGALLPPPGFK